MEKYYSIANDFSVLIDTFADKLMLELRGAFKPKRLSESKVRVILDNSDAIAKVLDTGTDGHYPLKDMSVILSHYSGTLMCELRGEFRPQNMSANVVKAVIKYAPELRKLLKEHTPATVNAAKIETATKELAVNAGAIGTDKKSAKDKATSVIAPVSVRQEYTDNEGVIREVEKIAPSLSSGFATIQAYLTGTYKLTNEVANIYATDSMAIKEYADYLKANTIPSFAEMKKVVAPVAPKTFAEMKQSASPATVSDAPKTSEHTNNATYQAAKKNSKVKKEKNLVPLETLDVPPFAPVIQEIVKHDSGTGIPVSFCVQIKGMEHEIVENSMTRADNNLKGKTLERQIIHNGVKRTEQKLYTGASQGSGPNKYFFSWIKQGYIYNARNLDTGKEITGKELKA